MSDRDRRVHARTDIELRVGYGSVGEFLSDWTSNVSVGGMFLRTTEPKPVGTRFKLRFQIPEHDRTIEAQGEVCWVIPGNTTPPPQPGMGIRFADVHPHDQEAIARLIARSSE
jgi:type IV pilus assembly protein PilZ